MQMSQEARLKKEFVEIRKQYKIDHFCYKNNKELIIIPKVKLDMK